MCIDTLRVSASVRGLLAAILIVSLSACGGGGGGGNGGLNPSTSTPSPGGFWSGTATYSGTRDIQQTRGIINEQGKLFFAFEYGSIGIGSINTQAGGNFSGTLDVYSPFFTGRSADGQQILIFAEREQGQGSLSGNVRERSHISGSLNRPGYTLIYNFDYDTDPDAVYQRSASLATIAGNYYLEDIINGVTIGLSIDAQGNISGGTSWGCVISGSVSILNPQYNLYDLYMTFSYCDIFDGEVIAMGMINRTYTNNDTLSIGGYSPIGFAIAVDLIRQ